jgi:hypothetical protein
MGRFFELFDGYLMWLGVHMKIHNDNLVGSIKNYMSSANLQSFANNKTVC